MGSDEFKVQSRNKSNALVMHRACHGSHHHFPFEPQKDQLDLTFASIHSQF